MRRLLLAIIVGLLCAAPASAIELLRVGQTAHPLLFQMIAADGFTGVTGLSPTVYLSKDGASGVTPSGAITEVDATNLPGLYKVAGNATDEAALGTLILYATGTGCIPFTSHYKVVAYDPDSATNLGLSYIDTNVGSRGTSTYAGGAVASVTGDVGGKVIGGGASTITGTGANAAVASYASGQDPATLLLTTPANKLAINASGQVTYANAAPPSASDNGTAAATAILVTPANKLATNASGQVTITNSIPTPPSTSDIATALLVHPTYKLLTDSGGQVTSTNGGGGGGGVVTGYATGQDPATLVWGAETRTLTSASGPTASDIATAVWASVSRTLSDGQYTTAERTLILAELRRILARVGG